MKTKLPDLPAVAVHPGEILVEDFMEPLSLTQKALAQKIGVSTRLVNEICVGKRSITPETALRLAKAFSTSPQFWAHMQAAHDLAQARDKNDLSEVEVILAPQKVPPTIEQDSTVKERSASGVTGKDIDEAIDILSERIADEVRAHISKLVIRKCLRSPSMQGLFRTELVTGKRTTRTRTTKKAAAKKKAKVR